MNNSNYSNQFLILRVTNSLIFSNQIYQPWRSDKELLDGNITSKDKQAVNSINYHAGTLFSMYKIFI